MKNNKTNIVPTETEIHSFIQNHIKERFNIENEYNIELLKSLNTDLRIKTMDSLNNIYDSLDIDNYIIITQEVLERLPLFDMIKESTTVQEQSDDSLNEIENSEDTYGDGDNNGIIGKKTNEINYAWEKASKRVKQYISSVSIQTDILNIGQPFINFLQEAEKQGNTSLIKNYEYAIKGSHLYSNLIKMLVNTPSYKMIGLLYSISDINNELKLFTHKWFKDIYNDLKNSNKDLVEEINTSDFENLYNVLKQIPYTIINNNSEHFSFITSDLEKNRIFLWDIVYDESGKSKFLNANNRETAKQVFNRWNKNWEAQRIHDNISFDNIINNYSNIYTNGTINILDKYVYILESDVNYSIKSSQVLKHINNIKEEFKTLGIELPDMYIKYSLIHFTKSINKDNILNEKDLEWYSNFSSVGIEPLTKEMLIGIQNALEIAKEKETYTIYDDKIDESSNNSMGAIGRLKKIAESVAVFDPTVIPSSFNNQEGKRIYDIVPPSDLSRRFNLLKDLDNINLLKDYIKSKDASIFKDAVLNNDIRNTYYFYSFFTNEQQIDNFLQNIDNNPLFKISQDDNYLNTLFSSMNLSYAGGIRQDVFEVNTNEDNDSDLSLNSKEYGLFSDSDGKSYSNADNTAKIIYQLTLLSDNENNLNNIKTNNGQKYAYYKFTQPESKSTVPLALLPYNEYIKEGNYTNQAKELLFSIFKQEYDRIAIAQKEIDEFTQGLKKDGYNENYHYKLQKIENLGVVKIFKNSENKFFYLDINNNNNPIELTTEQLSDINKDDLVPRGLQFFNFNNDKSNINNFAEKARKINNNENILTNTEENEIKNHLVDFMNYQFNEYVDLLKRSDIGIIKDKKDNNDENAVEISNLLPKGFHKNGTTELDRNKLFNALLNDFIMSYSINSLLYGDNSFTSKDSVDFVKRAGGIIGSGNNYGSGESNIILIRSEEKVK